MRDSLSHLSSSILTLTCPLFDSLMKCANKKLDTFNPASKATCSLDPIPTRFLIDILPEILPTLVHIVNLSLSSGLYPDALKSAIIKPLLKKSTLDPDCLKNYRPVSNLPFLSKVIEKVVGVRLFDHLRDNDLLEPMQSAYKPCHSTETALLKAQNDILIDLDKDKGVFLALLDLSAAFDTVDY